MNAQDESRRTEAESKRTAAAGGSRAGWEAARCGGSAARCGTVTDGREARRGAHAAGRIGVESLRRTPETNVMLCDDYSIFKKKRG